MTAFFTDLEASGAGEFLDTAGVGVRYTITSGTVTPRIFFPAIAPGGSQTVKIYSTAGALLHSLTLATTNLDAWNSTSTSASLAAGTYDVIWSTTRYKAISGFFSGGSVTRGNITGVTGKFNPTLDAAPNNDTTAAFMVDIDHVPSGGTPFTKDYDLRWNVLNSITKDVSLVWNVLNSFTKDVSLLWNVLNSLTKDYDLQWRVLNAIAKDVVLRWNVVAVFNKDYVLYWNVGTAGTLTYSVWRLGVEVPATIEGVWNGTTVVPYTSIELAI